MFEGQLTIGEVRLTIWDFILGIVAHIKISERENSKLIFKVWERIEFGIMFKNKSILWLLRLNISIYTSLNQQEPNIQINHSHNSGSISIFWENFGIMKE